MAKAAELPSDLAAEFPPFESIDPNDVRYLAKPVFVAMDDDSIRKSVTNTDWTANDGSRWRMFQGGPRRTNPPGQPPSGTYPIIFCRLN